MPAKFTIITVKNIGAHIMTLSCSKSFIFLILSLFLSNSAGAQTQKGQTLLSAIVSIRKLHPEEIMETPASPARVLMPRKFFFFFDLAYNNMVGIEKGKRPALHFIDTQVQPTEEILM
ncbi:MAG: hypothetical protein QHH14_12250 [Clostridiales bacterium]|nr:hypothetical protein [Clostridiales bacterium]